MSFTLRPDDAGAPNPVTIEAQPTDPFTELDPADNDASTTLTPPDVVLTSVNPGADALGIVRVQAHVSGVPAGTSVVRFRLGGVDAGTGLNQVHFTLGDDGADGEGPIDCYTSNSTGGRVLNGLYATCTGVQKDADGSFDVDMRLWHQHGRTSNVTMTVIPVGVEQATGNDTRSFTLR